MKHNKKYKTHDIEQLKKNTYIMTKKMETTEFRLLYQICTKLQTSDNRPNTRAV